MYVTLYKSSNISGANVRCKFPKNISILYRFANKYGANFKCMYYRNKILFYYVQIHKHIWCKFQMYVIYKTCELNVCIQICDQIRCKFLNKIIFCTIPQTILVHISSVCNIEKKFYFVQIRKQIWCKF